MNLQQQDSIELRSLNGKPFVWSFSLMKAFDACPDKTFKTRVTKAFKEEFNSAFTTGNTVHASIAKYVHSGCMEKFACHHTAMDLIDGLRASGFSTLAEIEIGVTPRLTPCGFFDEGVWGRGKIDLLAMKNGYAAQIDWKTGKKKANDRRWDLQRKVSAFLAMVKYPDIHDIQCTTVHLDDEGVRDDPEEFSRAEMPAITRELVDKYNEMVDDLPVGMINPGYHCKWCPVATCSHHPG